MNKFIFILFSFFVLNMTVFGQTELSNDLFKSFKRYDLVKLNNKKLSEKAKAKQTIEFQAYGRNFNFVLSPNDLRAKNYKAFESSENGDRELAQTEITTYKGKLKDDADSEVRFTISEGEIEGFIYTGDYNKFFITKASKFSKRAQADEIIVYSQGDLLKTIDLSDDTASSADIEAKIGYGLEAADSLLSEKTAAAELAEAAVAGELRAVEVATEADYQWVSQTGSATAANNEILGILNLVDGIYKRDLNLTIKVTFQHAWSTADPFTAGSTNSLLDSFLSYWNSNYPASRYARDVAHLFTGKFSNQGIAYQTITCRNPSFSYGLTARSGSVNHLITAHEIGHNLGAEHVANSGACASSIMNPSITFNATAFCESSKSQITNFVSVYGSCLTATGTTTPTPTPTPVMPTPTPFVPTPTPYVPTPTPYVPTPTPYVPTPTPNVQRTNVALASSGAIASASSDSGAAYAATGAINGSRVWANGAGWRDGTPNIFPDYLQVDFAGVKTINEIVVYSVRDDFASYAEPQAGETFSVYGITDFEVQYWTGTAWATVPNGYVAGNNQVARRIAFAPVATQRIRLAVNSGQNGYSRVVELEAWTGGTVTATPTPTPNATPTPATPTPTPSVQRTNVALSSSGAVASASSDSGAAYAAAGAINGSRVWANGAGWRDGTPNAFPDYLQVDFNGVKTINEVALYFVRDDFSSYAEPQAGETFSLYGVTDFEVQYWTGSVWATVQNGAISGNNQLSRRITFAPVATQRVRVVVNSGQSGYSRIVELEAWGY